MSKPPLWEVMTRAYDTSPQAPMDADDDWTDRHGYAAEIRAVRDYIRTNLLGEGWQTWQIRQLVDLLNEEADRAEMGEVEHG